MISNDAVGEIAAFGALATRYRQYDSRLAPFCAGSLEPQARSAVGQFLPSERRGADDRARVGNRAAWDDAEDPG
jgi:hypothetical protein